MNADRISAGENATSRAVQRRARPGAVGGREDPGHQEERQHGDRDVEELQAPGVRIRQIDRTTQAAPCMTAPMMTGYSTWWPK